MKRILSGVIVLLLFSACAISAHALTRHFYDSVWPGHPDSFRAETALLPRLSFEHFGEHFWEDHQQALIFLSACCAFALPQLAVLSLIRGRLIVPWVVAAVMVVAAMALRDIWQRYDFPLVLLRAL
jgi:hypothetical protein